MTTAFQSLNLLYCYAPEDQQWPEIIDAQLSDLKRQHQIISRFDGALVPNPDQETRLHALFNEMDMVLLLVSRHFQAVEPFWQELCQEAWAIRWRGGCRVVALILEPVAWNHAPAEAREILPREGVPPRAEQGPEPAHPLTVFPDDVKPLAAWPNQEQAFEQIAQYLRETIARQWLARGDHLIKEGMTVMAHEALAAYEEALRLNPLLKDAWRGKAVSLLYRGYRERAREKAARQKKATQSDKAHIIIGPKLYYEEALLASEEALRLDPTYLWAWHTKASALAGLKRDVEALQAYDEFLQGKPTHAGTWHEKSKLLKALGRKREAHQADKTARQLGWRG